MIVLDLLVGSIAFQCDQASNVDKILAGETEGLEDQNVVLTLSEVESDQLQVVLRHLVGADGKGVASNHACQSSLCPRIRGKISARLLQLVRLGHIDVSEAFGPLGEVRVVGLL